MGSAFQMAARPVPADAASLAARLERRCNRHRDRARAARDVEAVHVEAIAWVDEAEALLGRLMDAIAAAHEVGTLPAARARSTGRVATLLAAEVQEHVAQVLGLDEPAALAAEVEVHHAQAARLAAKLATLLGPVPHRRRSGARLLHRARA